MSEFVAGAFVDVKPNAKGFRADLKKQLDAAVKNTNVKIPVELDPKRFKSTVQAAARQAPAKIPIEPGTSVTDLRKSLKARVDAAAKGLKVTVAVDTAATGRGSRGGATGAAAAATGAAAAASTTKTTQATTAATTSRKKLTDAEKQAAAVKASLTKADNQLAISSRLVASAAQQGIIPEEKAQRLRDARQASSQAVKAVNDRLAISQGKLTAVEKQALEGKLRDAQLSRTLITEKQKELKTETAQTSAKEKNVKVRQATAAVMGVEVTSITKLNSLHLVENELLATEAALRKSTNRARELGLTSIVTANAATAQEIGRRKELIAIQRDEIKGESARSRTQKTAARGGFSTALSLLGVRGATLAANNAFLIGAASAAVFAKSLASFAGLEEQLNVFQATAGATAEQMRLVSEAAHDLGVDISLPGVTAADAAQSMAELARAGLSVTDSIAAARGVLELAAAAQIANAEAAQITASALNAFGLEGEEAVRVADLLANAANASQGNIQEMAAAMQQALTIANLVGFSLQDTVAQLTLFAQNGLKGSDAGTSLRTALSRLIAPTRVASQLLDGLGISLRDAQGNLRPDVFVQFGEATKNLSPALRDMIAQTIAGQDAIRAFAIGADEGRRGLERTRLQMAATGTAAQLAGARAKGLGGAFRALGSNIETLGTQLGEFTSGPVSQAVKAMTDFVGILNNLATGDLGGVFAQMSKDFDQFIRNTQRHGAGFAKIFNPTSSFQEFREGLREIFTPAAGPDNKIAQLQEALARLNALRVQAFDVGADIGPITEQIKRIRAELRKEKIDAGLIIPVTDLEKALAPLEEAKNTAQNLRREILDSGGDAGDVRFLDDLLRNIGVRMKLVRDDAKRQMRGLKKDMQDEISGNEIADSFTAQFKLIAQNVDLATPEVLGALNDLTRKIKGVAPLTGAAGKEVGQRLMASITAAITAAVEEDNPELAASLKALADKIAALFGGSLGQAFKNVKVPLTSEELEEALLPQRIRTARAEAFGSVSDQIAAKEGELAAITAQLKQVVKGSEEEEKILNQISAKKAEIRSLREGQATEQKEKDAESDKRVADSLSAAERGFTNRLAVAKTTETLKDDIKRQVELRAFYIRQIATIKTTVKDADARRQAIAEAEQNVFEVEQDLIQDRRKRREQLRNLAVEELDDAAERAAETETLKDDVKRAQRKVNFWRRQVAIIKQLVKDRKATAEELKEAQDELDEAEDNLATNKRARRTQRREQIQEGLELDITFAQTKENKGQEIKARQNFIRFLEQQKKFFKGNTNKLKELRNEIAEQKKAIKELNAEAKGTGGTTVFDLLTEFANTFKASAGNIITADQPFNDITGFQADISQFLKGRSGATNRRGFQPPGAARPGSDAITRNDRAHFDRLIEALDRNTDAELGRGNTTTNKKGKTAGVNVILRNDRRFWDSSEIREATEG